MPAPSPTRQRALLALARHVAPKVIAALGATWRFELPRGAPAGVLEPQHQPAIFALWHRCLLSMAYLGRGQGLGILVSQHRDGEWIAQAAGRMGYRVFRG